MYEHDIYNIKTGEREIIFSYSQDNPFKSNPKYDPKEWRVVLTTYID